MSRRDIAKLAFVIAGVYALFEAVPHLDGIFYWIFAPVGALTQLQMGRQQLVIGSALPALLLVMAGISFLLFSGRLARRMFPDAPYDRERILALPALAYSVVGLVCFVWGLSSIWRSAITVLSSGFAGRPSAELIGNAVLILFGVSLFLGSHHLARIWLRLHYAGLRRQMGLCICCGYDLTGNTTGTCPECGTQQ